MLVLSAEVVATLGAVDAPTVVGDTLNDTSFDGAKGDGIFVVLGLTVLPRLDGDDVPLGEEIVGSSEDDENSTVGTWVGVVSSAPLLEGRLLGSEFWLTFCCGERLGIVVRVGVSLALGI
mmetsp:Transcript_32098/g.73795  ORF Transcript_32098/g.73795 Transcript_32098/m.73795 type:complete len:120 (+) Transcript_32098:780-1139(+)